MSEQSQPASGDALAAVQRMIEAEYSGALGESRRASNTVAQRLSRAYSTAASNLLEKAVIRLGRGDEQAARAFVARALDLPYDEHEEAVPALWEAHMILFTAFSDDVEESEPGDLGWLDRVESVVRGSEEAVQRELRSCLVALFDMDLSSKEQRRLRALVRGASSDDEPFAGVSDREERIHVVVGMLEALLRYADLVDEAGGA
jgi:hypothetical protein